MDDELTKNIAGAVRVVAPDGLEVRILNRMKGGSMAEFRLGPLGVGRTIRHRTVEEIWFITSGSGEIWRDGVEGGRPVALSPGVSVAVPPGTAFQVRAGSDGFAAVAITMPPWPGEDEAELVPGRGPWVPES